MCFTDFPTETYAEAMDTLRFLEELQASEVALYIVGEFDLTHGALVAQEPARFGIRETWQLDGDLLGTGLFYEETRAVQARRRRRQARRGARPAVGGLAGPALSVGRLAVDGAHRLALREIRAGRVSRARASWPPQQPFGAASGEAQARFDLGEVARSDDDELAIWHQLVRAQRHVSRAAYHALAKALPPLAPKPRRYRFAAGQPPVPARAAPQGAAAAERVERRGLTRAAERRSSLARELRRQFSWPPSKTNDRSRPGASRRRGGAALGLRRRHARPAPPARGQRFSLRRRRRQARHAMKRRWRASSSWRSRRRGATSGSARRRTATCKPPGATRAAASSIATTRAGAPSATRPSTTRCSSSAWRCPRSASASTKIWSAPACRAKRCSPPSCACSRPRSSASATRSTRAPTSRSA